MSGIIYRQATAEDIPTMAALRSTSGWSGGAGADTMRRYLAGEHHPQQARAARVVLVAELQGTLIGFIAGHLTERFGCDGELQWVLVAPEWRGSAVAGGLLNELAKWFAVHAARRVCVNVGSDNAQARRFYARHGAVELSEHWMVWPDITKAIRP